MTKQIIQSLLENQGFTSSESLCNLLKQPLSVINREILVLNQKYPGLLVIKENCDKISSHLYVKIAPYGDHIARSLLWP